MKKDKFTWKVASCQTCGSCDIAEDNMVYWCNVCGRWL